MYLSSEPSTHRKDRGEEGREGVKNPESAREKGIVGARLRIKKIVHKTGKREDEGVSVGQKRRFVGGKNRAGSACRVGLV